MKCSLPWQLWTNSKKVIERSKVPKPAGTNGFSTLGLRGSHSLPSSPPPPKHQVPIILCIHLELVAYCFVPITLTRTRYLLIVISRSDHVISYPVASVSWFLSVGWHSTFNTDQLHMLNSHKPEPPIVVFLPLVSVTNNSRGAWSPAVASCMEDNVTSTSTACLFKLPPSAVAIKTIRTAAIATTTFIAVS